MLAQFIKNNISPNSFVFKILRKFHNPWIPPSISQDEFLEYYDSIMNEVYFIEIGANDGKSNDPIHKYIMTGKWKGVLIEPVESIFKRLKDNYRAVERNVKFLNVAVGNEEGEAVFYAIKESVNKNIPEWYDHLGSFSKEVVLKHKNVIPNIEELIEEKKVRTIAFQNLIQEQYYPTYNLLQIDTEGFDFEIIKMIDWTVFKPDVVIFEHRHLAQEDHKKSISLLKSNGYQVFLAGGDTMGIAKNVAERYINDNHSRVFN